MDADKRYDSGTKNLISQSNSSSQRIIISPISSLRTILKESYEESKVTP